MNKELYDIAKMLFLQLIDVRDTLAHTACVNVALEKYLGSLWIKFLDTFYGKTFESKSYPVFDITYQDWFDEYCNKRSYSSGIFFSGEYYIREDVDSQNSILYELLQKVFESSHWKLDYFLADLAHMYTYFRLETDTAGNTNAVYDESEKHFEDDEHARAVFETRSNEQLIGDSNIVPDFFHEDDVKSPAMVNFFENFRNLYNECSASYSAKYLLIKSTLLPYLLRLKRDELSIDDQELYVFLMSIVDAMKSAPVAGWLLSATEPSLTASYFVFDLSEDYFDVGNDNLGLAALPADLFLIPYLVDEGIKELNSRYHFMEGGLADGC